MTAGLARQGWPDPLRKRQESPGKRAPCASSRASVNGLAEGHSSWSRSPNTVPGAGFGSYASNPGGEAEPDPGWPGSVACGWVAVHCCEDASKITICGCLLTSCCWVTFVSSTDARGGAFWRSLHRKRRRSRCVPLIIMTTTTTYTVMTSLLTCGSGFTAAIRTPSFDH
jgi:hypothetical protein